MNSQDGIAHTVAEFVADVHKSYFLPGVSQGSSD